MLVSGAYGERFGGEGWIPIPNDSSWVAGQAGATGMVTSCAAASRGGPSGQGGKKARRRVSKGRDNAAMAWKESRPYWGDCREIKESVGAGAE